MNYKFFTYFIVLSFIFLSCSDSKKSKSKADQTCNTCYPIELPNEPFSGPPLKNLSKSEINLLRKKRMDGLRRIDFRDSVYKGYLNYPIDYVPRLGRRSQDFKDKLIERTDVDTILRIKNHDLFMGQVMTNRNRVAVPGDAKFRNVDFNCEVDFTDVTFRKNCYFEGVSFNKNVEIHDLKVKDLATFTNISYKKPLTIGGSIFENVYFKNIKNTPKMMLFGLTFKKLFFEESRLDSLNINVSAGNYLILNKSNFKNLSISGQIDTIMLSDIVLDKDLSLINISDKIYNPSPNKLRIQRHMIFLHGIDVRKLDIDYQHFKLLTRDFNGNELPPHEIRILYEGLMKNHKDRGRTEGYQLLDIEYQKYLDRSFYKWQSSLNEWWWNFGYDPVYIFEHILLFLGIFSAINFFILEGLQKNVYSIEALTLLEANQDIYSWKSFFKCLKRIWFSIAYTAVLFLLLSIKIEHLKLKSNFKFVLGTIYVIIMHIIGLICLGYVANFILQK